MTTTREWAVYFSQWRDEARARLEEAGTDVSRAFCRGKVDALEQVVAVLSPPRIGTSPAPSLPHGEP